MIVPARPSYVDIINGPNTHCSCTDRAQGIYWAEGSLQNVLFKWYGADRVVKKRNIGRNLRLNKYLEPGKSR